MKTLLTTSIFAAICAAPVYAAEIYRTVDKDGNVVFTDVPTSDRSESVELQKTSEYTPVAQPSTNRTGATAERRRSLDDDEYEEEEVDVTYSSLTITSPEHDAFFRNNAGNVRVAIQAVPALADAHQFELLLDGQRVQRSERNAITIPNVDRGTHILAVRIIGEAGDVLMESDPSTFHLGRISAITSQRARNAPSGADSSGRKVRRAPTASPPGGGGTPANNPITPPPN